ncbi:hypothetical protein P7C70_g2509, partial [Phenoliferia sp. Uapishka_3]
MHLPAQLRNQSAPQAPTVASHPQNAITSTFLSTTLKAIHHSIPSPIRLPRPFDLLTTDSKTPQPESKPNHTLNALLLPFDPASIVPREIVQLYYSHSANTIRRSPWPGNRGSASEESSDSEAAPVAPRPSVVAPSMQSSFSDFSANLHSSKPSANASTPKSVPASAPAPPPPSARRGIEDFVFELVVKLLNSETEHILGLEGVLKVKTDNLT